MLNRILMTLAAGALLPLAFSPFHVYAFAFFAPAVLCHQWLHVERKEATLLGWLFGLGLFGVGTSWVYTSINKFGNTSPFLAIIITILFVMLCALLPATLGWVFKRFFKNKSHTTLCLLVFPGLWVIWEALRAFIFGGFPWLYLGYSALDSPLSGLAPLIGTYGLSWVIATIAGALTLLGQRNSFSTKWLAVLIIVTLIGLGALFEGKSWTQINPYTIQVSLIQGNFSEEQKWDQRYQDQILRTYFHLSREAKRSHLIVWPEAAIPTYPRNVPTFINTLDRYAEEHRQAFILGAPRYDPETKNSYNAMLLIGKRHGEYRKRQLVAFGEYTPIRWLFKPIMSLFKIPMSDFTRGQDDQAKMQLSKGVTIAPFICYETTFPNFALQAIKGTQLIVTILDDTWFGHSIALQQQLQMTRMRALETGREAVVSSSTGITAFIDSQGEIASKAPIGHRIVLTHAVHLTQGSTPLMWWGYWPVWSIITVLLMLAYLRKK